MTETPAPYGNEEKQVSIIEYSEVNERIMRAVLDRVVYAERKHPREMTFEERWRVSHKEIWEAREAIAAGDFDGAAREYIDSMAADLRNIKHLMRFGGARL